LWSRPWAKLGCRAKERRKRMSDVVSAVKFIRSCELSHRQFKGFLDEI